MKKVKWKWDFGVYVPFCPSCGEPAYGKEACAFCGKKYKWVDGKYIPTVVVHEGYKAVQSTNNDITVYDEDGVFVSHSPCGSKYTEEELKTHIECVKGIINVRKEVREERERREGKT